MLDNRQVDGEELKQAIHAAFDQLPIPDEADLGPANNRDDPDAIQIQRRLGGKAWSVVLQELLALDLPELYFFSGTYWLFTPIAFHYYLPAFMIVSLDPVEADTTSESLFSALAPHEERKDSWLTQWFTACMALVTPAQREAIRLFILYVNDVCEQLEIGNITDVADLRQFWFPEGFPRQTADDTF